MQPYHGRRSAMGQTKHWLKTLRNSLPPCRRILSTGRLLTFSSNWSVAPRSPLDDVYAAVIRRTLDNHHSDGGIPEQKITLEEALMAQTVNNS
ncbi:MAG: putative amidohydrolase YtcJ [Paraglaciecola sp.]|jgi:predicted amidohydrolase YtcJ